MNHTAESILHINVRPATKKDEDILLSLVDALADYEKLPRPTPEARGRLIEDCFGPKPRFEALLSDVDNKKVGYAFFFETYSSFLALPTLYLEDLFVLPEYRNKKVGYSLFAAVMKEASKRGCGRMEWAVLHWNKLAIDFYESFHAKHLDEWYLYRMTRDEITRMLANY